MLVGETFFYRVAFDSIDFLEPNFFIATNASYNESKMLKFFGLRSSNRLSVATCLVLIALIAASGEHCGAQDKPAGSENEQRARDEGMKRFANLERIQDRIELDRRGCFTIDEFFREMDSDFAGVKLRSDKRLYALIYAESVRKELQLEPEMSKALELEAKQIISRFDQVIHGYSLSGVIKEIDDFESELVRFEERLKNQLTAEQQERLQTIQLRNGVLAEGLPQYLEREASSLGLLPQSVQEINAEIQRMGLSHCREANRQFIDEINKILPGYLGEFRPDDLAYLPLIPLELFLVVAENAAPIGRGAANSVKRFDFDLQDGDWIFPGPTFQRKLSGKLGVTAISLIAEVPRLPLKSIRTQVGAEMSSEQRLEFQEILAEVERRNEFNRAQGGAEDQDNFIANKKSLELIKGQLLPVQLHPVSNYVKLHSLFTLGPVFIYEHLDSPKFPPREVFDQKLQDAKSSIAELIAKNSTLVANEIVRLVNEKSDLEVPPFKVDFIVEPERSTYERLFRPILMQETYKIGK